MKTEEFKALTEFERAVILLLERILKILESEA